jgi:hypothetical protein
MRGCMHVCGAVGLSVHGTMWEGVGGCGAVMMHCSSKRPESPWRSNSGKQGHHMRHCEHLVPLT